jgi:hypothetical protein
VSCPEVLYEEVIEVNERIVPIQEDSMLKKNHKVVQGTTGERVFQPFLELNSFLFTKQLFLFTQT